MKQFKGLIISNEKSEFTFAGDAIPKIVKEPKEITDLDKKTTFKNPFQKPFNVGQSYVEGLFSFGKAVKK